MEPEPEPELLGAAQRLSGLWRAKGKTMRGGSTEEFLQLDVSARARARAVRERRKVSSIFSSDY